MKEERIPESVLADARARVPVANVARRWVTLEKAGSLWRGLCPFHNENSPSFLVYSDHFHCFGCGAHGDAIAILMQLGGLKFGDAVKELLGSDPREANFEDRFRESAQEYGTNDGIRWLPDEKERARRAEAQAIWRNAGAARGTLAERYLRGRALSARIPPTIRFATLYHREARGEAPALIAAVQAGSGYVTAVQRIYLDRATAKKTSVIPAKKTKGPMADGAVRLARAGAILGIAEGVETALSAQQVYSLPVWASLGAQRMKAIRLPDQVEEVMIFRDNGDVGFAEAVKAAEVWEEQGRRVMIEPPPAPHKDWNDALSARGSRE